MSNLSRKELRKLKNTLKGYCIVQSQIADEAQCSIRYVQAVLSQKDKRYSEKVIQAAKNLIEKKSGEEFFQATQKHNKTLSIL